MPPLAILTVVAHCVLLVLLRDVRSASFRLVAVCTRLDRGGGRHFGVLRSSQRSRGNLGRCGAPEDWAELRDQWHTGQTLRTVFTVPALALLAAAATLPATRDHAPKRAEINPYVEPTHSDSRARTPVPLESDCDRRTALV